MLDNKLIKSALALTWKTIDDMNQYTLIAYIPRPQYKFSIEKFWWYLLSPWFLDIYEKKFSKWMIHSSWFSFAEAIYKYQSWNEKHLITLLQKICPTDQTM